MYIGTSPIRTYTAVFATWEYKILKRQLAMRNEKNHTFINRIQEEIQKYKLEPVEELMEQPKSKALNHHVYWYLSN
jgi:hypothetical protein